MIDTVNAVKAAIDSCKRWPADQPLDTWFSTECEHYKTFHEDKLYLGPLEPA